MNQQDKRNIEHLFEDFMLELTANEKDEPVGICNRLVMSKYSSANLLVLKQTKIAIMPTSQNQIPPWRPNMTATRSRLGANIQVKTTSLLILPHQKVAPHPVWTGLSVCESTVAATAVAAQLSPLITAE
ncbi:MAG: hypothetical protein U1C46_11715 [Bacteroidales bacterium]|nr:hypothetical protein [Bacteroidales bacterium]MDZ4205468.1 hypothetical protein [Bacteroidales bacterium]